MTVNIDCPPNNYPATVVVGSGQTTGYISASGQAQPDDRYGAYVKAWAYVYPGPSTPIPLPPTPPPSALSVTPPSQGSPNWYFPMIPGAVCQMGGSGGAPCTLVVWAQYPGSGPLSTGVSYFFGVCGTQVSCPPPGSGALASSGSGVSLAGMSLLALSMVPAVWKVLSAGFASVTDAFNGTWLLHLRGTRGGHCYWENEGDGLTSPLVQMSCESPLAALWQLTFRLGVQVIRYQRSAAEWNMFGTNDFAPVLEDMYPPELIPAFLTAIPD
jgi:hypothetical protein